MRIEADRLEALELPIPQGSGLDFGLQLFQLGSDILARTIDEDAVIVLAARVICVREVGIVLVQVAQLEMRKLPFSLAEGVVPLRVLSQQRGCDLLPEPNPVKRPEAEFLGRDLDTIPACVRQQVED